MRRPIIGEVSDDGATPRPRRRALARRRMHGKKELKSQSERRRAAAHWSRDREIVRPLRHGA